MDYKTKYLKYKTKYVQLKEQIGGLPCFSDECKLKGANVTDNMIKNIQQENMRRQKDKLTKIDINKFIKLMNELNNIEIGKRENIIFKIVNFNDTTIKNFKDKIFNNNVYLTNIDNYEKIKNFNVDQLDIIKKLYIYYTYIHPDNENKLLNIINDNEIITKLNNNLFTNNVYLSDISNYEKIINFNVDQLQQFQRLFEPIVNNNLLNNIDNQPSEHKKKKFSYVDKPQPQQFQPTEPSRYEKEDLLIKTIKENTNQNDEHIKNLVKLHIEENIRKQQEKQQEKIDKAARLIEQKEIERQRVLKLTEEVRKQKEEQERRNNQEKVDILTGKDIDKFNKINDFINEINKLIQTYNDELNIIDLILKESNNDIVIHTKLRRHFNPLIEDLDIKAKKFNKQIKEINPLFDYSIIFKIPEDRNEMKLFDLLKLPQSA